MAMSKSVGVGSIVIGCTLLVLTLISVISGAVAMSKLTSPAAVSIGLWGLYFIIPAVLSILAGYKKLSSLLAVALGMDIIGIILAIVGMIIASTFWAVLGSTCRRYYRDDYCLCIYNSDSFKYEASCSDLDIVRGANGCVTIIFAFFAIVSFVGSIYGCIGTCCASREPGHVVHVTTAQPPNTVFVSTTQAHQTYNPQQQQPPPYSHPGAFAQDQVVINTKQ